MIPIVLPDKAQIETAHLDALSRGVYDKFNDLEEYTLKMVGCMYILANGLVFSSQMGKLDE